MNFFNKVQKFVPKVTFFFLNYKLTFLNFLIADVALMQVSI